ncbi:double-strand-break repair protein rad21-like protein 1 isoform X2 [Ornithorhynchus anatinus]|uniref:double-strand-break repair protein rad21-like protein 1 isoform X2 n=1 Tax=Ornithorhynchus anatinus TaxID=9258 RepID=UPI0010A89481|nr:double-strand-break repair protein rad21-like protein 1 isoform X2 [Ornithorhynchus anatinus]
MEAPLFSFPPARVPVRSEVPGGQGTGHFFGADGPGAPGIQRAAAETRSRRCSDHRSQSGIPSSGQDVLRTLSDQQAGAPGQNLAGRSPGEEAHQGSGLRLQPGGHRRKDPLAQDLLDLPKERLEASYAAITLPEEFHDFEVQLPPLNDISVGEHFSLNQSRAEDITLKEEWRAEATQSFRGLSFLDESVPSAPSQLLEPSSTSLWGDHDATYDCRDGFGDEGSKGEMIDELLQDEPFSLLVDVTPDRRVSLPPTPPDGVMEADSPDPDLAEGGGGWEEPAGPGPGEDDGFALAPVEATAPSGRKKRKKRVLLVDPVKEISRPLFRKQILHFQDTLNPDIDMAPPRRKLMEWMETGGIGALFSRPAQPFIGAELEGLFASILSSGLKKEKKGKRVISEATEARNKNGLEAGSLPRSDSRKTRIHDMEPPPFLPETDMMEDSPENLDWEPEAVETMVRSTTEDLQDISSEEEFESRSTEPDSLLTDKEEEGEEAIWNKTIHPMLNRLRHSYEEGSSHFSLLKLCEKQDQKQVAMNLYSFLVLKKHGAIHLSQSGPYADIIATVGPMFAKL